MHQTPQSEYHQVAKTTYNSMRIIWFVLSMSVLIYGVAAIIIFSKGADRRSEITTTVATILAVTLPIGLGSLSTMLFKKRTSESFFESFLQKPVDLRALAVQGKNKSFDPVLFDKLQRFTPTQLRGFRALGSYQTTLVICLVINEVITIAGLVLFFVTGARHVQYVLALLVVSFTLNYLIFPLSPSKLSERLPSIFQP